MHPSSLSKRPYQDDEEPTQKVFRTDLLSMATRDEIDHEALGARYRREDDRHEMTWMICFGVVLVAAVSAVMIMLWPPR